jgi:hypothetical protein
LQYRYDPDAAVGASVVFPVAEPHAFRLALEQNPTRLVIEVAKTAAIGPGSDMLTVPSQNRPTLAAPIFYLQGGDIWSFADGKATNLTDSEEIETALAPTQGGGRLAFCRASSAPGDATEISSLWVMDIDGSNQQELAAPGRSCAEPAFSPDGTTIAFTVDEDASGVRPVRLSIWTIDLTSGDGPVRVTAPNDEWSRFGPQWLADQQLTYAAQAEDGRSTLFLRDTQGRELDIGAPLLVADSGQNGSVARYLGFGKPITSADGESIAVEAFRADRSGADLVVLDQKGNQQKDSIANGFWNRPVGFAADGTLYYLTSLCMSDAAQTYALIARPQSGSERTVAIGQATGSFGPFTVIDQTIVYVAFDPPGARGPRGPLLFEGVTGSSLWAWDLAAGPRARLVDTDETILMVGQ